MTCCIFHFLTSSVLFIYLFLIGNRETFTGLKGIRITEVNQGDWIVCSVLWLLLFHYSLSVYVQVDATKRGGIARFINHSCDVGA